MLEWFETINWAAVGSIIMIDILLGGDNAVIIALASRNLPKTKRMQGIIWGTVGAIVMRVVLIFFAMQLLDIPFLKVVGGLLLIWIGIKLIIPHDDGHDNVKGGETVLSVVKTILIADLVMSLDNVIAIAGAAGTTDPEHQMFYVIFGLLLSVPIIIWGSTLVLKLIDKFPVIVIFGAGLLGWIAGHMIITDVTFDKYILDGQPPSTTLDWSAKIIGAFIVMGVGLLLKKQKDKKDLLNKDTQISG